MAPGSREWKEPLLPWMIEALNTLGFDQATPVQAASIPLMSGNKDCVVQAVTGSGKTLAFVLPILVRLARLDPTHMGQTNVIVLSPTRELAQQTHKVLQGMVELSPDPTKIRSQLITGGNNTTPISDLKSFMNKRPHVLVATPGRLFELLQSKHVKTNAVDMLVLDEADRLLDANADQTINKIIALLPKQKRVALFSATMSDAINNIVRSGMRNPVKISVTNKTNSTPETLSIKYIELPTPLQRIPLLTSLIKQQQNQKTIIYCATCTSVTHWYQVISHFMGGGEDLKIFSMHGKLPQTIRLKTLDKFTECIDKCVLITTDVAARGLDIPDINLVVQMDPPADPDMFVHRSGRTARAGNSGTAVVFLNNELELGYVDFMRVRKVPMQLLELEPDIGIKEYTTRLQRWVREDRARHDLAVRSFLSFIRFYSKHTITSIFRISGVDLLELAKSYGILRLPRMPELKNAELPNNGYLCEEFDFDAYKYRDAQQEAARLAKLQEAKHTSTNDKKRKERNNEAWSGQTERKKEAQLRRDKRLKRGVAKKEATMQDQDSSEDEQEDWKELVKERKKQASGVMQFDL